MAKALPTAKEGRASVAGYDEVAARTRYYPGKKRSLASDMAIVGRMQHRTPGEQIRDAHGSRDTDIRLKKPKSTRKVGRAARRTAR